MSTEESGPVPVAADLMDPGDEIGARIVRAAAEAIIESGFGGATTEAIARSARTSKRSLYQRFPDRNALFEHVMAWLCSEAGERPDESPTQSTTTLADFLAAWGFAVLSRFSHPRGQRVLVAAISASTTFPAALDIFWQRGPGQAVEAIAERLANEQASGHLRGYDTAAEARRFILACCGPVVLDRLFAPDDEPDAATLQGQVIATASRFIAEWGAQPAL